MTIARGEKDRKRGERPITVFFSRYAASDFRGHFIAQGVNTFKTSNKWGNCKRRAFDDKKNWTASEGVTYVDMADKNCLLEVSKELLSLMMFEITDTTVNKELVRRILKWDGGNPTHSFF